MDLMFSDIYGGEICLSDDPDLGPVANAIDLNGHGDPIHSVEMFVLAPAVVCDYPVDEGSAAVTIHLTPNNIKRLRDAFTALYDRCR